MPTARAFLSVLLLSLLGSAATHPPTGPHTLNHQASATPAGGRPVVLASATAPGIAPGSRGAALACSAVNGKETISPCTASAGILRPGTSGMQSFVVWNRTIEDDAFSLSCTRSGAIAQCSPSSSSLIVRAGTYGTFTVTFTAGADGGSGTANVTAAGLGTLTATISASVNPIQVTPRDSVITRGPSTVYTQNFTVRNLGNTQKTINLAKVCDATLGCTLTTGTPVTLAGNATSTATVQYTTGLIGSSYPVRLAATASTQPSWTDTGSVVLSIPNPLAPTVSSALQNGANRLAGLCAVGCFEARASYGTPAYTSMDTPRSLALVYSSAQARPMGVVQVVAQDRSARPAQVMSLSLLRPNNSLVDFTNGKRELFFATADSLPKRLAGQFDATGLATGIHRYTAVVTSYWTSGPDAGTTMQTSVPVAVLVVNERASPYGAGWSIAGLARLYTPDTTTTAITDGAGSLSVYTKQNGVWAAPAGDFGRLDPVLSGSIVVGWTRVSPAGVVDSFSATGYLLATRDRFGNRSSYGYDASNRLQTVVDPAGKVLTLAYTGGKLDTITDPGGRVSHFAVNGTSGDLTTITDPTGTVTFQGAYDTEHRLTQATDRRGGTWLYRYDFAGKLASDSTPLVRVDGTTKRVGTRYRSLEAAILIDPATAVGDSITRPAPRVWSDSVRALVVATSGDSTRYALDAYGAPTRIERPLLRTVTTITRDAASHVTKTVTAVRGQTVQSDTAVWDGPRLVTQTDQTSGMSVTYAYDPTYSLVTSVSGSTQRIVNYLSADKKRVDSARVGSIANDSTIRYSYDSCGRVTKIKDQLRDSTVFTFDTAGYQNTLTVTQGTRVTRYRYDGYGRLVRTVNPRGDSVVVSLDSLNRTRSEAGPNGAQVSYGYDALFLRTITDAKGQTYTYARNALGWLDTLTHANTVDPLASRQERWEYAATGIVTAHVNRRGQQTSFTYDAQGRLRTRTLTGGQTTTFDYDTAGYWSTVSNGESTDTVLVTPSGTGTVAKEITWRGGARYVVTRTTDTQGLVRSRVLTQGTDTASLFKVSYGYDAARRLDTLLIGGKRTRLTYNADGVLRSLKLPTGDSLTIGITGAHRPYTVTYNRSALNKPFGGNYTLDTLDRIVKRSAVGGDSTWTYAYDALGQLTSYTRYYNSVAENCVPDPSYMDGMRCTTTTTPTLVSTSTFTYDTVGNRTDLGTALVGGNRLVKFNGDSLVYDADGNLVKRFRSGQEVQRLYWNSIGELVAVWTSGADSVTFGYDGWGRRVRKTTTVQSLRYIYAGQQVLTEVDAVTGARVRTYSYYAGVDQPHSVVTSTGATYYYLTAVGAGHVVGVVDSAGVIKNRYRYTPFGALEDSAETIVQPLRFTAREYDRETGLYYYRARYYDPRLARFISEDPAGQSAGTNQYAYVGNDPVNKVDPSGMDDCWWHPYIDGSCKRGGGHRGPRTLGFAGDIGMGWDTGPGEGRSESYHCRVTDEASARMCVESAYDHFVSGTPLDEGWEAGSTPPPMRMQHDVLEGCSGWSDGTIVSTSYMYRPLADVGAGFLVVIDGYRFRPDVVPRRLTSDPFRPYTLTRTIYVQIEGSVRRRPLTSGQYRGLVNCRTGTFFVTTP